MRRVRLCVRCTPVFATFLLFVPAALTAVLAAWWIVRAYARAGGSPRPALIGMGVGLAAASGLYLALGSPGVPDEPYAPRMAALLNKDPARLSASETLAVLDLRAKQQPNDPRPLIFAGEILTQLGQPEPAIARFSEALRRDDKAFDAYIGLGRAEVAAAQGRITPGALDAFGRAKSLAPENPVPWFYEALTASLDGRNEDAARLWPEVLSRLASNDPRRQMAQQMIADAHAKMGVKGNGK